MKPLYTPEQFNQAKSRDKLPYICIQCNKIFYIAKHHYNQYKKINRGNFCSIQCQKRYQTPRIKVICKQCNTSLLILNGVFQRSKTKHFFCNQSCAATYNQTHKKHGCRRSKLEIWIESQLKTLYPTLSILFNDKTSINSELDIYIPSLKLAFELNGVFHYEPIFGDKKFNQIQNNDHRKFQACLENQIELCIIDTSTFGYFKLDSAQRFLIIITNIINQKLERLVGNSPT